MRLVYGALASLAGFLVFASGLMSRPDHPGVPLAQQLLLWGIVAVGLAGVLLVIWAWRRPARVAKSRWLLLPFLLPGLLCIGVLEGGRIGSLDIVAVGVGVCIAVVQWLLVRAVVRVSN